MAGPWDVLAKGISESGKTLQHAMIKAAQIKQQKEEKLAKNSIELKKLERQKQQGIFNNAVTTYNLTKNPKVFLAPDVKKSLASFGQDANAVAKFIEEGGDLNAVLTHMEDLTQQPPVIQPSPGSEAVGAYSPMPFLEARGRQFWLKPEITKEQETKQLKAVSDARSIAEGFTSSTGKLPSSIFLRNELAKRGYDEHESEMAISNYFTSGITKAAPKEQEKTYYDEQENAFVTRNKFTGEIKVSPIPGFAKTDKTSITYKTNAETGNLEMIKYNHATHEFSRHDTGIPVKDFRNVFLSDAKMLKFSMDFVKQQGFDGKFESESEAIDTAELVKQLSGGKVNAKVRKIKGAWIVDVSPRKRVPITKEKYEYFIDMGITNKQMLDKGYDISPYI
ncbi:MAG: hypothetical protein SV062_12455 [Thermodesulfobacteriota bacterium]|nr:hypothetical protein [Thermodesulfobacteriota bacterium]